MTPTSLPAGLVVDFLNTVDVEAGTDVLDDPRGFARWCRGHGTSPVDSASARRLRDELRAMAAGERYRIDPIRIPLAASRDGGLAPAPTDVVEAVCAAVMTLTATGDLARIKLCPADDCREAFYDRSRNRSRVWCDMADCGNLAKVRALRGRRTGVPTRPPTRPS